MDGHGQSCAVGRSERRVTASGLPGSSLLASRRLMRNCREADFSAATSMRSSKGEQRASWRRSPLYSPAGSSPATRALSSGACDLFAPALARIGLHPDRVIYCETWKDRDVLRAMEEGLRYAGIAAVIGEATRISLTASRRLQLCAGESGVTALLLRRWRTAGEKVFAREPNAATTRWRVSPSPSAQGPFDHIDRQRWQVELVRVKGGEPHSWIVEACDAQGRLGLPATLADQPAAAEGPCRTATG